MAKAVVETKTEIEYKQVVEDVIQLTLSLKEARALAALTALVWGNVTGTYHREMDSVRMALIRTGKLGSFISRHYFKVEGDEIYAQPHLIADK